MTFAQTIRIATALVPLLSVMHTAGMAQDSGRSAWQVEKCRVYQESWNKALDLFGTDNVNYNFIAQNENFIASGCTTQLAVCPQSNREIEIANALTIELMNAGTASTFLPFRCESTSTTMPLQTVTGAPALDSELCISQLDTLNSRGKLTPDESAVFEAQCACLERNETGDGRSDCAQ